MISVDHDEQRALVIAVDDGHRTTLTLAHQDGVLLLQHLTEYYGRIEYGHGTDEPADKKGLLARLLARFFPPTPGAPR
jgi:hypothetical protein